MTKRGMWPVRAMYMLVAVALAISLIITAAPSPTVLAATASNVTAEWDRIDTPTMDGFVVAPDSTIIDYALASQGEVAYAVVRAYDEDWDDYGYRLLKSTDHAATWTDITDALEDVIDVDDGDYIDVLVQVATDWEDPDFVAVALSWWDDSAGNYYLHVFVSDDGGETFVDADEVEDGSRYFPDPTLVSDLAVSYENADGKREIAIGGMDDMGSAALFRCTVTGDSPGAWKDATEDEGWDDDGDFWSFLVTDIIFSPSWATDKTILVTTVAPDITFETVYLQTGTWGTSPGWNEFSTLGILAVPVKEDVPFPIWLMSWDARAIAGMTLPEDYNSKSTDTRLLWVWVNYYDVDDGGAPACGIMRVDNDDAHPVGPLGQILEGTVWLTNVSYRGTIDSGEAIAGLLGDGVGGLTDPCEGVQVYHNDGISNMDICCERWKKACKPPTGHAAMAVSYVGENKAYAVALHGFGDSDEGAWSMTFDDGYNWNQLSLIDTYIDYLSDVAVSPDCNKTMLVSVNLFDMSRYCEGCTGCDSVWLHAVNLPEAPEYSGKWLRTWCSMLTGDNSIDFPEHGLLRLAPEETNGDSVFLVDRMSGYVYWSCLETLDCWAIIASTTVEEIVDLAPQDADTLYALDADGDVAMFDEDEWHLAVASGVDDGWTIAVWGDDILVGGQDGDVAHSADGGETFTELEDIAITGLVTVAFDSYFGENGTIYAALADAGADNGIYLWVIDESMTWTSLGAEPLESQIGMPVGLTDDTVEVSFTGVVLDNADGNPKTSPTTGGVLYASYVYNAGNITHPELYTGVARTLTPIVDIECVACTEWDYLVEGLTGDELFRAMPDALKICGCLTPDSHSRLFAIDWYGYYDMVEGEDGTVWRFIDCYSKSGPDLTMPDDGFLAPADACDCINAPFTVSWDRLCDACFYEIQIASDSDFDNIYWTNLSVLGNPVESPSYLIPRELLPGETYYWRVRSIEANTGQVIRSWWSEERSLTVAPSLGTGAYVVAPEIGATGMPNTNIAFLWGSVAVFDSYNWVLSPNADFSSPVETKTGLTSPAYTYTGTALAYDTPYYWRVTAIKDGAPASVAIGTFRTVAEPEEVIPPVTPTTPFWVWVVIAIGAVLVIVVIVLIFRTRRV